MCITQSSLLLVLSSVESMLVLKQKILSFLFSHHKHNFQTLHSNCCQLRLRFVHRSLVPHQCGGLAGDPGLHDEARHAAFSRSSSWSAPGPVPMESPRVGACYPQILTFADQFHQLGVPRKMLPQRARLRSRNSFVLASMILVASSSNFPLLVLANCNFQVTLKWMPCQATILAAQFV